MQASQNESSSVSKAQSVRVVGRASSNTEHVSSPLPVRPSVTNVLRGAAWIGAAVLIIVGATVTSDQGAGTQIVSAVAGLLCLWAAYDTWTRRHRLARMMHSTLALPLDGWARVAELPGEFSSPAPISRASTDAKPYALVVLDDGSTWRYRVSSSDGGGVNHYWAKPRRVQVWRQGGEMVAADGVDVLWPITRAKSVAAPRASTPSAATS